jgi:hypothetical protein
VVQGDETQDTLAGHLLRRGEIVEIVGRLSSGRTSLVTACLRDVTRAGAIAALVDVDQAFDPVLAERGRVDLSRLLWVRCGGRRDVALRATDLLVRCPGFALVALDLGETVPRLSIAAAFRLKLAVRRSHVALLILGRRRIAGAGAALALEARRAGLDWSGPVPTRLRGMRTRVHLLRGDWNSRSHAASVPGHPRLNAASRHPLRWSA